MSSGRDLIIIGSGAAGVSAAVEARALGLDVLLLDEQSGMGGNAYRNIERVMADPVLATCLGADYLAGSDLLGRLSGMPEQYWNDTQVWHIDESGRVGVLRAGKAQFLHARRVLVACGAMERPVPVPGWTLPGVMTVGAAQTLLKTSAMVPDMPTVMAGNGPLLLLVAKQLLSMGTPLVAVVMTTGMRACTGALRELPAAVGSPGALLRGLGWIRAIRSSGVPLYFGATSLSIQGSTRTTGIEFDARGRRFRLDAGVVLLHEGLVPDTWLTMAGDCEHAWDERQLCWRPKTNAWGQTSRETIYAAGDCAGILGAGAAPLSATLSVLSIAYDLRRISARERDRRSGSLRKALRKHYRLRRFLDAIYRPSPAVRGAVAADTVVCRCEGVTAKYIREVAKLGCVGPNQAKSFTRCGMGPCQGRMCAHTLTEIFAAERAEKPEDVGYLRIRPPVKPLTLEQFAGAAPDAWSKRDKGMLVRAAAVEGKTTAGGDLWP